MKYTEFSPETEARIAPFIRRREEQAARIVALWARLRLLKKLPPERAALDDKITRDWQLKYGLDSLDGEHLDRLEKTLQERIKAADEQLRKAEQMEETV